MTPPLYNTLAKFFTFIKNLGLNTLYYPIMFLNMDKYLKASTFNIMSYTLNTTTETVGKYVAFTIGTINCVGIISNTLSLTYNIVKLKDAQNIKMLASATLSMLQNTFYISIFAYNMWSTTKNIMDIDEHPLFTSISYNAYVSELIVNHFSLNVLFGVNYIQCIFFFGLSPFKMLTDKVITLANIIIPENSIISNSISIVQHILPLYCIVSLNIPLTNNIIDNIIQINTKLSHIPMLVLLSSYIYLTSNKIINNFTYDQFLNEFYTVINAKNILSEYIAFNINKITNFICKNIYNSELCDTMDMKQCGIIDSNNDVTNEEIEQSFKCDKDAIYYFNLFEQCVDTMIQ